MTIRNQKIAILGGGIGGLTTAIALHQKGFSNITIYERLESAQGTGAGLVLWPNATCILNNLGLETETEKIGGNLSNMVRWSSQGEPLGKISISAIEDIIGYKSYAVARHDLLQLLIDRIKKSTDYHCLFKKYKEDIYQLR